MRPQARAALLMMLPGGPVDVKGRSGRVIAQRGGLWDDRVSYLKVTLITEVIQFAFGAQTKVPSRGPLTS